MNRRQSQRGVALIITLIMLAVVTIVALLFLGVARRNRGGVSLRQAQTDAEFAADAAFQRAKAEIIAEILSGSNVLNFDLMVSRNKDTNVTGAVPLLVDPRVPVFVNTNRLTQSGPLDYRYYLDLNRNGTNDPLPMGDPDWIGQLDRIGQSHGSTNKMLTRFSYIVIPAGKALDINSIHNTNAPLPFASGVPRYYRNQGAGAWEINLAALLHETDTNAWPYYFDPLASPPVIAGRAFTNAHTLVQWRYNVGPGGGPADPAAPMLPDLFNAVGPGAVALTNNLVDDYGNSPEGAPDNDDPFSPWAGAENPRHFFTHQDFFNTNRTSSPFDNTVATRAFTTNFLRAVSGTNGFKYYDLLAQLATDTGTFNDDRINLNWVNLDGHKVGEFLSWHFETNNGVKPYAELFFTNAAQRILETMLYDFNPNTGTNGAYLTNVSRIMVYPTNLYSSAMHRVMQLAANIYDATSTNWMPSVFRPLLGAVAGEPSTNIYIVGWTNDNRTATLDAWLAQNTNGVPLVVGARRGLPSFNEYSLRSDILVTRKLNVLRITNAPAPWPNGVKTIQTNQMYILGMSNVFAIESWNSYSTPYTRPWSITGSNTVTVTITNGLGLQYVTNFSFAFATNGTTWPGWQKDDTNSFLLPLYAGPIVLSNGVYSFLQNRFIPVSTNRFEDSTLLTDPVTSQPSPFPLPYWVVNISNQIVYAFSDVSDPANARLLDFVVLNSVSTVDVHRELLGNTDLTATTYGNAWGTNRTLGPYGPTDGLRAQWDICVGTTPTSLADWKNFASATQGLSDKNRAIDNFRVFVGLSPLTYPATAVTSTNVQAPYNPVARLVHMETWQANDPLIHTHLNDLRVYPSNFVSQVLRLPKTNLMVNLPPLTLGDINDGYAPWGNEFRKTADTNSWDLTLRDPGLFNSDYWDFPTNQVPSVGWLGRVHRGSPWQTVYFKAQAARAWDWENQSRDPLARNHPTNDWKLVDLFNTALTDFSTRGLFSINQTRLGALSAALAGVVVVSNTLTPVQANLGRAPEYTPLVIQPVGSDINNLSNPVVRIFNKITAARDLQPSRLFTNFSALLAIPELTTSSPYLNTNDWRLLHYGIDDFAFERLPQQILGLLRLGEPRFVIYAYGQSLKPERINASTRLVENYQVTSEFATRTVLRIDNYARVTNALGVVTYELTPGLHVGPDNKLRAVVESFNILPPD